MCLFVVLQVHRIDAMVTHNGRGCGVSLPHAYFSPQPACPAQTTDAPVRGMHPNMSGGLFGVGWGGATRCGALLCCKPFPCELVSTLGCFDCVFVVSNQHVACECASHGFDGPQCVFWVIVDETHRNSIRYTCFATKTMSHMAIPTLTHLCLSPCMHAHVGLNECCAHAKLNVRTCMKVGCNHTLAVLKIITALRCGLNISAVPKPALSPHQQTTLACVPHQKTSHGQHNTDYCGLMCHLNATCKCG
jgi:hypothetical protein